MTREATKHDHGKPRFDLIPPRPLVEIAEVFAFGAEKYGERNWEAGFKWGRLVRALLGHILAWWMGEENDSESGKSHLAHAGCCLLMLMETRIRYPDNDDRRLPDA